MSYIHYCCTKVKGPNPTVGSSAIAASPTPATIASSGTSQQSNALTIATAGETDAKKLVWHITNGGDVTAANNKAVYIVFGSNPAAVANGAAMRKLLLVNETFVAHAEADAEKFAVIDADIET